MKDAMSEERRFLEALQELLKTARSAGGVVTEEEIGESFAGLNLKESQLAQVREYLAANGIGVNEALPVSERLSEEENAYLSDYMETVAAIPVPDSGLLDAVKLSAMAGDPEAQSKLAEYMLGRVIDIAKLYLGQGVFLEDLIGAGNEALSRGVKLLAPLEGPEEVDGVLARMIMDAMEDQVAINLDDSALDRQIEDRVNLVADKARELAEDLGRKVTAEELSGEGELTLEEIQEAVRFSGKKIEDLEYDNS